MNLKSTDTSTRWSRPPDTGIATLKFGRYTAALGQPTLPGPSRSWQNILKTGDICYVKILSLGANGAAHVSLEQDSGAQGALLAIDNATGGIKAMVGGRDFNDSKFDRVTQAVRQVGSSFKPYVYTTVIDEGASPDDTDPRRARQLSTRPSGPYSPHNYDEKFEGIITLRRALAQSRNIPALKLPNKVGIKTVIELRRALRHHRASCRRILPVALGAGEITLDASKPRPTASFPTTACASRRATSRASPTTKAACSKKIFPT